MNKIKREVDKLTTKDISSCGLILPDSLTEKLHVAGTYFVRAFQYDLKTKKVGKLLWDAEAVAYNLIPTAARNDMLDKYLAASGYTAAWYVSLVDSTGYTGVAAGDTAASHSGWAEYTSYSEATRPAIAWAAASAGSKAFSSAINFTIPGSVTLKGCMIASSSTKGGAGGLLYSAGTFTEGDRVIVGSALLAVSYSTVLN